MARRRRGGLGGASRTSTAPVETIKTVVGTPDPGASQRIGPGGQSFGGGDTGGSGASGGFGSSGATAEGKEENARRIALINQRKADNLATDDGEGLLNPNTGGAGDGTTTPTTNGPGTRGDFDSIPTDLDPPRAEGDGTGDGTTTPSGLIDPTGGTGAGDGTGADGLVRGENVREATIEGETAFDSSFEDPAFAAAEKQIADITGRKDIRTQEVIDLMKSQGNLRQTAIDRLYGEDSRISQFFQPAIQTVEEQLLDTEGFLTSLSGDIKERHEDVGLTTAQKNRIESKERGELVDQFDKLTRSHQRLRSGLDIAMDISDKEFNAIVDDSQKAIDTAVFELENTGMEDAELELVKSALNQQLQRDTEWRSEERNIATEIRAEELSDRKLTAQQKEEKRVQVEGVVSDILNFVFEAGAGPTDGFDKVIADVQAMLDRGASVSEIQLGILKAVGTSQKVRDYIEKSLNPVRSGGGGSRKTLSDSVYSKLIAAGHDIEGINTVYDLTQEQARDINTGSDDFSSGYFQTKNTSSAPSSGKTSQ